MAGFRIEIKPAAEKQYLRLDKKTRKRIKSALYELEAEENPFSHPGIRPLAGQLKGDWRLRVGDWRVLIEPDLEVRVLHVYAILPRGGAYRS